MISTFHIENDRGSWVLKSLKNIIWREEKYLLIYRILKVTGMRLIFINEINFQLTKMRSRGHAPIGERCIIHKKARRIKKLAFVFIWIRRVIIHIHHGQRCSS